MVGTHESSSATAGAMTTNAATMQAAATASAAAKEKAQEFAHRVVEFAEYDACVKFFEDKEIDFDKPNATGSTVLMSVVARARVDLIGYVMDRTTNVESVTIPNGTTVLHLAAMATNPQVIRELTATADRKAKLKPIANSCNRNDDTPLMMACVVKNAIAAKLLLEYLDAFPNTKNASGMTALMCASRLQDEREGPSMDAESAAIVSLLLAYGADVNATESAGRQSALHFALLTRNVMVIEQLLTISDINLSSRNKAGHTPLELAKKLKLDDLINAAVESQWQVVEDEARVLSEQVAEELANAVKSSQRDVTSPQKKKDKKKKKTTTKSTTTTTATSSKEDGPTEPRAPTTSEADGAASVDEEKQAARGSNAGPSVVEVELDDAADDEWMTASKKKPRRKESISSDQQATTTKAPKQASQKPNNNNSKPKQKLEGAAKSKSNGEPATKAKTSAVAKPKPEATPTKQVTPQPKAQPQPVAQKLVSKSVPQSKPAPWTNTSVPVQPTTPTTPPPAPAATHQHPVHSASPVSHPDRVSSPQRSPFSYDELNAIFQRMFPIAEEMDIPVESFIAGADTRDTTDLLGGLSISQVEMLQEAHLQAYHYLNERKIELTRVLEAQKLEAQLQLRQRFYHLP